MKNLSIIWIIISIILLSSCQTINHDVTTDLYYFDITLDKDTITSFDDSIEVEVIMTTRVKKNILFSETHDSIRESIIQTRFIQKRNHDDTNPFQLYNDEKYIQTTHDPKWVILKKGEKLQKSFSYSRINPNNYHTLVGQSGKYYLEVAVYEGNDLTEEDWISTDIYVDVKRNEVANDIINIEKGTFKIDYDNTSRIDDQIIIVDIQFTASTNLHITLPNQYYEKDSAIIQARFVLDTDTNIQLYDHFSSFILPAYFIVDINSNESLDKVYLFTSISQSIDNNDAPSGLYKLQIALYQGEELTENEWIDTAITYQVVS